MLVSLKDRVLAAGISLLHGLPVFVVLLRTAEFEVRMLLHLVRQRGEGLVLQTVRQLAAHVAVTQRLSGGNEIRLDALVIAPHDLLERFPPRPVQALDGQIQERNHDPAGRFSDLGKLAAVEENVLHGKLGLRQKGHGKVGPDGGSHHQRQPRYAAAAQKFLHLTHLVRLAGVGLPGAVNRGSGQNAEIALLQIPRHRLAAGPGHAHGVKEQHSGILRIPNGFKPHGISPPQDEMKIWVRPGSFTGSAPSTRKAPPRSPLRPPCRKATCALRQEG